MHTIGKLPIKAALVNNFCVENLKVLVYGFGCGVIDVTHWLLWGDYTYHRL